jgi:hypothetical protein
MPSQKKRPVALTGEDREELERVTTTGVHPASMIRRARVLLALDTSGGEVDSRETMAGGAGQGGPASVAHPWGIRRRVHHVDGPGDVGRLRRRS